MKEKIDPKEQYEAEKYAPFGEKIKPKRDIAELEEELENNN